MELKELQLLQRQKIIRDVFLITSFMLSKELILEKCFPLQGKRAHSLLCFYIHIIRKEEGEGGD